ncbi:MAG: ATP-binding protein, partial [Dehalococcoidia bacterium]|nr:ATP-binding protein [Dehalococcoidia bacterium]
FERQVLLICLLPEIIHEYERLFGYLNDDVTKRRPTIHLLLSLLSSSIMQVLAARRHFTSQASLIREQIVSLVEGPDSATTPIISRFVKIDEGILSWLLGDDHLDRRLASCADLTSPHLGLSHLVLAAPLRHQLERLVERGKNAGLLPICYLHGPAGVGRRTAAKAVCADLGLPLLTVDVEQFHDNATQLGAERAVRLVFREARLAGAAICWHRFDLFLTGSAAGGLTRQLLKETAAFAGLVFLTGVEPWEPGGSFESSFLLLEIAVPDVAQRQKLWQSFLDNNLSSLSETALAGLAEVFRLTAGQISDAVATARRLADGRSEDLSRLNADDLYAAARLRSRRKLNSLARQVDIRFSWNDIVLPRDQMSRLAEICACSQLRSVVNDRWGFGRVQPRNKGQAILFAGPSGTGKTMAASIIAGELGLDMFKIDLSTVVSKYIGETEKNLERIFQEGQDSNAILFFDEADALFGKRSEVSDSHDRYANIEIAYLLQRMEEYNGVVILATNLRRNLDEAFTRRLDFAVDFPLPDEEDRLRIWRKVLPPEAPLAEGVDVPFIARRFKLSGGSIRNAAVAAAYLAATDGQEIGMHHFLRAVKREHQKMGRLMAEADFGPYLELVRAD